VSVDHDDLVRGATFRPLSEVPPLRLTSAAVRFTATGSHTDGEFGLFRYDMPAGPGGPRPHIHRTFSESFYVLEGAVDVYDGVAGVPAAAGDFMYVPRNGVHAFRNGGDGPASMLMLFTPGKPRERYFTELAEIAASGRELSPEEWTEVWERNDQYAVDEDPPQT
jgi:mannose-6-phosphate isomerase-like protein (cupin superfamily)